MTLDKSVKRDIIGMGLTAGALAFIFALIARATFGFDWNMAFIVGLSMGVATGNTLSNYVLAKFGYWPWRG